MTAESNQERPWFCLARATLLLEQGLFERASEDMSMLEQAESSTYYALYQAALFALTLEDRDHYQKRWQRLLDTIDENERPARDRKPTLKLLRTEAGTFISSN